MSFLRAHAIVSGRVQGVWFRDSTKRRAQELGLGGFVRNLADGRVECHFEGPEEAVRQAVAFVRVGPPQAHVEEAEVTYEGIDQPARGFRIL